MSKRLLCKYFASGTCLKGEHCEYSHDWQAPRKNICTFYQKGLCSYGSRCRYEHVKASRWRSCASSSPANLFGSQTSDAASRGFESGSSSSAINPNSTSLHLTSRAKSGCYPGSKHHVCFNDNASEARTLHHSDQSVCSFDASVNCPHGENFLKTQGNKCPMCGKHCLHPFKPQEREQHLRSCEDKQKEAEALKLSQEIECSVCLERVLSKPVEAERKFGILSECDHPFCVTCIRNWRSSAPSSGIDGNSAVRTCPICRKLSYFVVPSSIWFTTKEQKQDIIDKYKARLKSIDCKHFKFGNGNCPFGTSCFYKHTVKPGSYAWIHHRPPPRRNNNVNMMFDMLDNLFCLEELIEADEDLDLFGLDDPDDDLSPMQMAFLLSQLGFASSGFSSDED